MRLIDADALEKYLSDAEIEATRQRKYVFASALNTICGNVRNFPTIEPKPHWIPCNEKPDRRDVYRVTIQCEHVDGYPDYEVCYGEYDEENGWFLIGEPVGQTKMVAWMRIDYVEPYQPEEESE